MSVEIKYTYTCDACGEEFIDGVSFPMSSITPATPALPYPPVGWEVLLGYLFCDKHDVKSGIIIDGKEFSNKNGN